MNEALYFEEVKNDRDYLVSMRRHFHMYPEVSKEEFNTADRIEEELKSFGLETFRVGETGVASSIKGLLPGQKTIVLRADIDGLSVPEIHEKACPYQSRIEGKSHACGHDAHTAALLGAAKYLSSHRDQFGGTILLNFQQGEEVGYGARLFVDGGYIDSADRSFGVHLESRIPVGKLSLTPGPNNASVDWFRITVKGKTAHVSVPNRGADALYMASQIVVGAQALITRMTDPTDSLLIGIGKMQSGTAYNIVADEAVMEGTIRAMLPETRQKAMAAFERLAKGIADTYGGEASIEWADYTSPLINDSISSLEAQKVARRLFGDENVITNRPYSLGGDDFAEYIIKVPGVYCYVGSGNPKNPDTQVAHHNTHFDIDEDCLVVAAAMHIAYAINFLNGTLDQA